MPAIEQMIYEGHQRQRHAALRGRRPTSRSPRPTSAAWSAATRRARRSTSTRSPRSSSRAWTPRSTRAWRRWAATDLAGHGRRSPTPAPPTSASRRSSTATASPRCATAGARGPASAVGLDRGQEPALLGRPSTSTTWSRPTPSTRCRCRRCSPPPSTRRSPADTADQDPAARSASARRRGHRPRATSPTCCWPTGIVRSRRRDGQAARRRREPPRGGRHRPPAHDRRLDPVRAAGPAIVRARQAPPWPSDVARRVWRKDETLWGAPGTPEIENRLGWLTISERDARARRRPARLRRERARARASRTSVLLGMGGSTLGAEVIRRSFGAIEGALDLHVLDSTDPAAMLDLEAAIDLAKTLFLVSSKSGTGRSRRSRTSATSTRGPAVGRSPAPVRRDHRSRQAADQARATRTAFAGCSRTTRTSAGATRCSRTSGSCPPRSWGSRSRPLLHRAPGGRAELQLVRVELGELGPVDRASWPASWRSRAATSSRFDRVRADLQLRPVGRAARGREPGQERQGHPPGGRRAARRPVEVTARTASSSTCATSTRPDDGLDARVDGAGGGRPSDADAVPSTAPIDLGGSSSSPSSRSPSPAGCWASTPSTSPTSRRRRTTRTRCSTGYRQDGHLPEMRRGRRRRGGSCSRRASPPHYVAILGYLEPSARFDAAISRPAGRDPRRGRGRPRRSATGRASSTRPGQMHKGGPDDGHLHPAGPRRRAGRRARSPAPATRSGRSRTPQAVGDLQHAARPRAAGRARPARGRPGAGPGRA